MNREELVQLNTVSGADRTADEEDEEERDVEDEEESAELDEEDEGEEEEEDDDEDEDEDDPVVLGVGCHACGSVYATSVPQLLDTTTLARDMPLTVVIARPLAAARSKNRFLNAVVDTEDASAVACAEVGAASR